MLVLSYFTWEFAFVFFRNMKFMGKYAEFSTCCPFLTLEKNIWKKLFCRINRTLNLELKIWGKNVCVVLD